MASSHRDHRSGERVAVLAARPRVRQPLKQAFREAGQGDVELCSTDRPRPHQRVMLPFEDEILGVIFVEGAVGPPPGSHQGEVQVTAAYTRRSSTDQQLTTRAAELRFASLRAYLADRAVTRRWPTTSIASELGVHPGTDVDNRLDQHGLPRPRTPRRPYRAIQRQRACWAAKRQSRIAELGFASVEDYLRVRRIEQGWSLRRMLTELQVSPAWLKDQLQRLRIP